jgi:hypothetical protein
MPHATRRNLGSSPIEKVIRDLFFRKTGKNEMSSRDKAPFSGGIDFAQDPILGCYIGFGLTTFGVAVPRVEDQEPFPFGGGMRGRSLRKQDENKHQGFHGFKPFDDTTYECMKVRSQSTPE